MLSLVAIVLVSDVVGTAMVPLIIVGATSNKLLNVIDMYKRFKISRHRQGKSTLENTLV
ncbi:MAG: hypothetical protein WBY28_12550 [Nitrososphaeraceae archaeon]